MVSEKTIRKWVNRVNKEFGLSVSNDASVDWFMRLRGVAKFIDRKEYYIVGMPTQDMWGKRGFAVLSCYVRPEYRNAKYVLKMEKEILSIAKRFNSCYIIQGSHLGDKYFKFLEGIGYKVCEMKKEI